MSIVASAFQYDCRADVDARHYDVDLAARLRELDDQEQHHRDPVPWSPCRVIAIVGPAESANHSSGTAELLGVVERGRDPQALGLRQRDERVRGVAEQRHAQHACGVALA